MVVEAKMDLTHKQHVADAITKHLCGFTGRHSLTLSGIITPGRPPAISRDE